MNDSDAAASTLKGVAPDQRERLGLRPGTALLVAFAVCLVGIVPTFTYLFDKWFEGNSYSHGPLIAAISIWLIWRVWKDIDMRVSGGSSLAAVALAVGLFGWSLSHAADVAIGVEFMLPAILWLTAASILGIAAALKLAFPIGFLYFAVPIWDVMNSTLQSLTTKVVSLLLPLMSVPAYIEGNFVQVPAGWFEIAGGCSGLHFLVVGLALSVLYGHLYYDSWKQGFSLVAIAVVMALLVNWVRVTTIIVAGHLTDMQSYLVTVDHYTFGWVLFGVALIPFYMLARRLETPVGDEDSSGRAARESRSTARVPAGRLAVVVVLLLAPAVFWARPAPVDVQVNIELPAVAGWQGPAAADDGWRPEYPGAHGEALGRYVRAGVAVDLYLNWFAHQTQERELIGFDSRVEGDAKVASTGGHKLELDRGASLPVREMIFRSQDAGRRLVWYWYQIGPRSEVRPAVAKLYGGWRALTGNTGAGLVAASVACETDCRRARTELTDWLQSAETPARNALSNAARGGSEN